MAEAGAQSAPHPFKGNSKTNQGIKKIIFDDSLTYEVVNCDWKSNVI